MWMIYCQAAAALYLVGGSLMINATGGLMSKFVFKVVPMCLGLPLAFGVVGHILGWPV